MTETEEPLETVEKIPKWLRHAQQNSWEGEILISGGAIFTLFQVSDFLGEQKVFFSQNFPITGLDEILVLSMIAVKGLTVSFILHLLIRGVWISLLSVNGLFPRGINFKKLTLSARYRGRIGSPTITHQVLFIDKLAGLIFYAGFAFSLFMIGCFFSLIVLFFFFQLIPGSQFVLIPLLSIFLVDFVFAGPLRRIKSIEKIYYPIYLFFNSITLAFLYRKSIQLVFSNIKRGQAVGFIMIFVMSTLLLSYFSLYKVLHLAPPFDGRPYPATLLNRDVVYVSNYYLDQLSPHDDIRWFAIESDVIEDDLMKIYVNYHSSFYDGIVAANENSFDKIITLEIDGNALSDVDWISEKRIAASQEGLMAMIPVGQLSKGKHIISVNVNDEYYKKARTVSVAFWKE